MEPRRRRKIPRDRDRMRHSATFSWWFASCRYGRPYRHDALTYDHPNMLPDRISLLVITGKNPPLKNNAWRWAMRAVTIRPRVSKWSPMRYGKAPVMDAPNGCICGRRLRSGLRLPAVLSVHCCIGVASASSSCSMQPAQCAGPASTPSHSSGSGVVCVIRVGAHRCH